MTLLLLLALGAIVLALLRRGPLPSGATVEPPTVAELAEVRAGVLLKLLAYEAERQERMRRYAEAWEGRRPSGKARGYLLEFAAGGER